jgi:hypothetical protein
LGCVVRQLAGAGFTQLLVLGLQLPGRLRLGEQRVPDNTDIGSWQFQALWQGT